MKYNSIYHSEIDKILHDSSNWVSNDVSFLFFQARGEEYESFFETPG